MYPTSFYAWWEGEELRQPPPQQQQLLKSRDQNPTLALLPSFLPTIFPSFLPSFFPSFITSFFPAVQPRGDGTQEELGQRKDSARPTGSSGRTPGRTSVSHPAHSTQETETPGAAQHRGRRDAGKYYRPAYGQALPSGHRRIILPGTTQINQAPSQGTPAHRT